MIEEKIFGLVRPYQVFPLSIIITERVYSSWLGLVFGVSFQLASNFILQWHVTQIVMAKFIIVLCQSDTVNLSAFNCIKFHENVSYPIEVERPQMENDFFIRL